MDLIVVRQEVKSIDSSILEYELELTIKRDLYGIIWSMSLNLEKKTSRRS